jgi:lambda repressor-like predicted transcriptional regulator
MAKRIYWGALRELGLSLEEIAEHTGCTYSTVQSMLAKSPPEKCYVQGVLNRAKEQVAAQ